MASTNTMLKQVAGLVGTNDITNWESDFLKSVLERAHNGDRPDLLSEKQVETLETIHSKHFAN